MPGSEKKVAQPYLAPKRAIIVYVDLPCSNVSYNSDAFSLLYSVGSSGYLMSNIAAPVSLSRSTLPSVSQSSAIHQSFQPAPTHLSPFVQLLGGLREDFPERERRHRQSAPSEISPLASFPDGFKKTNLHIITTCPQTNTYLNTSCAHPEPSSTETPGNSSPRASLSSLIDLSKSQDQADAINGSSPKETITTLILSRLTELYPEPNDQSISSSLSSSSSSSSSPSLPSSLLLSPDVTLIHVATPRPVTSTHSSLPSLNTSTLLSIANSLCSYLLTQYFPPSICATDTEHSLWTHLSSPSPLSPLGSLPSESSLPSTPSQWYGTTYMSLVIQPPVSSASSSTPNTLHHVITGRVPVQGIQQGQSRVNQGSSSHSNQTFPTYFPRQSYNFYKHIDLATPLNQYLSQYASSTAGSMNDAPLPSHPTSSTSPFSSSFSPSSSSPPPPSPYTDRPPSWLPSFYISYHHETTRRSTDPLPPSIFPSSSNPTSTPSATCLNPPTSTLSPVSHSTLPTTSSFPLVFLLPFLLPQPSSTSTVGSTTPQSSSSSSSSTIPATLSAVSSSSSSSTSPYVMSSLPPMSFPLPLRGSAGAMNNLHFIPEIAFKLGLVSKYGA